MSMNVENGILLLFVVILLNNDSIDSLLWSVLLTVDFVLESDVFVLVLLFVVVVLMSFFVVVLMLLLFVVVLML